MRGVPILVLAMVAGRDRAGYPHGVGNQKSSDRNAGSGTGSSAFVQGLTGNIINQCVDCNISKYKNKLIQC